MFEVVEWIRIALLVGATLAVGCADPVDPPKSEPDSGIVVDAGPTPDAGATPDAGPTMDGGVVAGLKLKSSNLAPSVTRSGSPNHNLNGRLGAARGRAASNDHSLTGGIVPGGARATSP